MVKENDIFNKKRILILFFILIISFSTFYSLSRIFPYLNPENKIGGSFDISYAFDAADKYTKSNSIQGMRRRDAPVYFYEFLKNRGETQLFMGTGAGSVMYSKYIKEGTETIYSKLGVGYGARTTFIWLFIQVGILGTFLFFFFHLKLFLNVLNLYRKSKIVESRIMLLGFLGMGFIFFVDSFTYSTIMLFREVISLLYFLIAGLLLNKNINIDNDIINFSRIKKP